MGSVQIKQEQPPCLGNTGDGQTHLQTRTPCQLLRMDSCYVTACFVVIGLPTVWIWDHVKVGCHSWNPSSFSSSQCVPLTEGYLYDRLSSAQILGIRVYICRIASSVGGTSRTAPSVGSVLI